MDMIERAINEYHRRTCVRFKPRTYERDYVTFTSDNTGCWSSVGRIGGKQVSIPLQFMVHSIDKMQFTKTHYKVKNIKITVIVVCMQMCFCTAHQLTIARMYG